MTMTLMEREALQSAQVLVEQFTQNHLVLLKLKDRCQKKSPRFAMTIARGSSDHAATFGKYLLETKASLVTASAAPSVFTLYGKNLPLKNCLVLAISQSGGSPDVAEMLSAAKDDGAITVAIVNQVNSAVARAAEYVIPMHAGLEEAVAATKTYIASLAALIHLVATLTDDKALLAALNQLPDRLIQASQSNWDTAIADLKNRHNALVIGRGYGFGIAQEAALKLKETCRLHAEALSGAELLHGPVALIEKNFPILMLAQQDETLSSLLAVASRMKNLGAEVLLALPSRSSADLTDAANRILPVAESLHPVCDPLLNIQVFYLMAAKLSLARGMNPDAPDNLSKVTQTW